MQCMCRGGAGVLKVVCEACGDVIAEFSADTRRRNEEQFKDAVCVDCGSSKDELLEDLADLEHRQWMHWSKYVAENYDIPEELEDKWRENWKSYSDLTEELKDKDRKWAKKALNIFSGEQEEVQES